LTLVEVLFVMIIFAILIGLVIGLGRYADTAARINQARADLGEWSVALSRWHDTFGEYPTSPDDTVAWLVSNTVSITRLTAAAQATDYAAADSLTNTLAMAAFFRDIPLQDPWRQFYFYQAQTNAAGPSSGHSLYSAGPDGNPETPHDNIYFSN
jgi:Tfp pilus assembly protein PilE